MNQINSKFKDVNGNRLIEIKDNKILLKLNQHNNYNNFMLMENM